MEVSTRITLGTLILSLFESQLGRKVGYKCKGIHFSSGPIPFIANMSEGCLELQNPAVI